MRLEIIMLSEILTQTQNNSHTFSLKGKNLENCFKFLKIKII